MPIFVGILGRISSKLEIKIPFKTVARSNRRKLPVKDPPQLLQSPRRGRQNVLSTKFFAILRIRNPRRATGHRAPHPGGFPSNTRSAPDPVQQTRNDRKGVPSLQAGCIGEGGAGLQYAHQGSDG